MDAFVSSLNGGAKGGRGKGGEGDVQVSTGWEGKGERNQHFDDGMFALEEECVGIPTL